MVNVKRIAIRVEYKHTLAVFSRMDEVAMSLSNVFPDWQRSAIALDLRNYETNRHFQMQSHQCFYECDLPEDAAAELSIAVKTIDSALRKFQVSHVTRAGLFQNFVVEESREFDDLVLRFDKKFHVPYSSVPAFEQYRLADALYAVDLTDPRSALWRRNLSTGPMDRKQYFIKHPVSKRIREVDGVAVVPTDKEKIPPRFLFIGIEAITTGGDVDHKRLIRGLPDTAKDSLALANQVAAYFQD